MKFNPPKFMTTVRIACALLLLAISILPSLTPSTAFASNQITNRSLTLLAGTPGTPADGGSNAGAIVKHQFTFTAPTSNNVQSIKIEYCTTAAQPGVGITGTCTGPTGLSDTAATIATQTGTSGWTIFSQATANVIILTHATAADIHAGVTITLGTMTNPTDPTLTNNPRPLGYNATFFARIFTYTSSDGTGNAVDAGAVAAAVTEPIVLTGTMPESLVFCTGATVSPVAPGVNDATHHSDNSRPDCTSATNGAVGFDVLFDPQDTATATSQMAASTNAGAGYQITVDGPTLKSGTNQINPMTCDNTGLYLNGGTFSCPSARGTSQFGMNLVQNVTTLDHTTNCSLAPCGLGLDLDDASNGGSPITNPLMAQPTTNYGTADKFFYTDGDTVAESNNGGSLGASNGQIYTVSYIVNVPGYQPAGGYTTTLNYICTATY